jgi:hypothetical protein
MVAFLVDPKLDEVNHDGTAAGETDFSWVCTVEAARRRYFG